MTRISSFMLLPMTLLGCAAGGTRPNDMSAAQHANAAEQEQQRADQHQAGYDPTLREQGVQCGPRATDPPSSPVPGGGCWTSLSNPTAEHRREAQRHRDLAAAHRAASEALRAAEARMCAGLSESDRDMSPFAHPEDIASVQPLKRMEPAYAGYGSASSSETTVGATVLFRATPGMTAEWLQRLVDCHSARAAAVGFEMPEMTYCPLTLKGVEATVVPARGGFAVEIRSDDAAMTNEILRRSNALVPHGTGANQ
jgi:hypothetical protein